MEIKITDANVISNFGKPYVIAEIGANHNGDMDLAKKMIEIAAKAGADCVKFQSWSVNSVFSKKVYEDNYFLNDDYRDREDIDLKEILEKYAISEDQLIEMKKYCDDQKIDCLSTPFSKREVDFLIDELGASFIKVASMDLNNYPLLEYFAKKNVPMIISTGLNELYEIDKAIKTIEETGNNKIIILHCVSIYPPENNQVNLKRISTLQQMYPDYPIGFSDHSLGSALPIASIALGAAVIEKHFTFDKDMDGWDHKVSADEQELIDICAGVKKVYESMGTSRVSAVEDSKRRTEFKRSLIITKDMKKGEKIKASDLSAKRPGSGLKPEMFDFVVGRTLSKDVTSDSILNLDDLL
jgi:N-acetylneuraminate synthase